MCKIIDVLSVTEDLYGKNGLAFGRLLISATRKFYRVRSPLESRIEFQKLDDLRKGCGGSYVHFFSRFRTGPAKVIFNQ